MKKITSILLFVTLLTFSFAEAQHQIIPAPRSYELSDGELIINQGLELQQLSESVELKKQLDLFTSEFKKMGIDLGSTSSDGSGVKTLKIGLNETAEDTLGAEGYHMVIEPEGILLMANSTAGTFNGLQTLKQLFPVKREVADDG
ncbi:glycoside hydrolase family 20 zincin-like fold domain-containing protein [Lutimonas sp.]|uniref:glycoside hydrolase family 20 zincin-like fold domain-containing protein n=1 Tax=Lutimonas sp. TaxID=1872403 RepID=UPI003C76933E